MVRLSAAAHDTCQHLLHHLVLVLLLLHPYYVYIPCAFLRPKYCCTTNRLLLFCTAYKDEHRNIKGFVLKYASVQQQNRRTIRFGKLSVRWWLGTALVRSMVPTPIDRHFREEQHSNLLETSCNILRKYMSSFENRYGIPGSRRRHRPTHHKTPQGRAEKQGGSCLIPDTSYFVYRIYASTGMYYTYEYSYRSMAYGIYA